MKKLLLISIISSLLISQTAFATVQYLDVDGNHSYYQDISFLSNQNIVQGYDKAYFIVQVDSEPTQMCVNGLWGDAVMHDKSNFKEQLYHFTFEDDLGKQNPDSPEIWYERSDFVLNAGDVAQTDWSQFDFNKSEDQLRASFAKNKGLSSKDIELNKTKVGGKNAVRVKYDYYSDFTGKLDQVTYFIPNALKSDNHTFHVSIGTSPHNIMTDIIYATKPNTITLTDEFVARIQF